MAGDWIKLHRALLDDGLWQLLTGDQAKAMIGLLLTVNWWPAEFGCRQCRRVIQVPAGSTTKSYRTLADLAHVSQDVMKRLVRVLVGNGFLINESRPRCHTLYRVKNWEKYQGDLGDPAPGSHLACRPRLAPTLAPTLAPVSKKERKKEEDRAPYDYPPSSPSGIESNTSTELNPGLHPPSSAGPPGPRYGLAAAQDLDALYEVDR